MTTVLPQASGVASERTPRISGALHGAIAKHTPAPRRTAIDSEPGRLLGIISPVICVTSPAASRKISADSVTLNMAQPLVAPISSLMAATKSGALAISISAAFRRMFLREFGGLADHAG